MSVKGQGSHSHTGLKFCLMPDLGLEQHGRIFRSQLQIFRVTTTALVPEKFHSDSVLYL